MSFADSFKVRKKENETMDASHNYRNLVLEGGGVLGIDMYIILYFLFWRLALL